MATEITDPNAYPERACRALADFILSVTDNKRLLGIRYAEWCDGAPALEASVAASAMAQDELGHSRALLPLLKDFDHIDPGIPEEQPREHYYSISFLDRPFSKWEAFVAANVLIGHALTVAMDAARASTYIPLRTRAVKILEEERFHWLHGEGWFKRLALQPSSAPVLSSLVEEILPHSLCWFGRSDDGTLAREGILNASPDELRMRFLDQVGPPIAKSQAEFLLRIQGGHWQYTGGMPWGRFDPVSRRLKAIESK